MKLLRVAMLSLSPAPTGWERWAMNVGPTRVETIPFWQFRNVPDAPNTHRVPIVAGISLSTLPVAGPDGSLGVPEGPRQECERTLEFAANTISVFTRSSRLIASLWPPVAFLPESDEERAFLTTARGIRCQSESSVRAALPIEFTEAHFRSFQDRLEGVASVATFFSTENVLGRYREAMRFVELAFALPTNQVAKKLSQFLSGGPFGYTRDEVEVWLDHRHGASHGDGRVTTSYTWESEVRPFIQRLEQAMLDILFNKATWHDRSVDRRTNWIPTIGTSSATGDVFLTQGMDSALECEAFDPWKKFPMALCSLTPPPAHWWCEIIEDVPGQLSSGQLRVLPPQSSLDTKV